MGATMNDMQNMKPVLVLGGTGKAGGRVAQRLWERGVAVRIGSREGNPRFDWDDKAIWAPVLGGVGAVYIAYYPDLAVPDAVEAVRSFTETAPAVGVRRIVLLSGRGEEEVQRAEPALQESGADWTIVRASWFAQNVSESFLLDAVLAGEVALWENGVTEPLIDADDLAEVAVVALTDASHIGQLYEVTGPRLMTFTDASGRAIRYREIPAEDYAALLKVHEVLSEVASLVMYLFTTVLDGRTSLSRTAWSASLAGRRGTSPIMPAMRRQPVSGGSADGKHPDQQPRHRDGFGRHLGRRYLLRVLDLRDGRARPPAARTGHRGGAVDQRGGAQPLVFWRLLRHGAGLDRALRAGVPQLGFAGIGLPGRGRPALPDRLHPGDDCLQCAAH